VTGGRPRSHALAPELFGALSARLSLINIEWQPCPVNDQERPEYMHGWRWEDPNWREWTGNDAAKILREALRRAVDIRDTNAQGIALGARPLVLLDVLSALSGTLDISGSDIWDGSNLWNRPRDTQKQDEAAFWKRHNRS
jgi:hypothetical protein